MPSKRAQRIKDEIPILSVLVDYGYQVHPEGGDREQQFSCDLHGDGHDSKPSARVYPRTSSFYCFACGKTYDAIGLVQLKEQVNFSEACRKLEMKYGLPVWIHQIRDDIPEDEYTFGFVQSSCQDEADRTEKLLLNSTKEKDMAMQDVLALWEVFDKINWLVGEEQWTEDIGKKAFQKLRKRALEKSKEALM